MSEVKLMVNLLEWMERWVASKTGDCKECSEKFDELKKSLEAHG